MTKDELARLVASRGGCLFEVGGSLRDELLGIAPKDRDFAVEGLHPDALPFKRVGRAFPVFEAIVDGTRVEIACARREASRGLGHSDFDVQADPSVTIVEDLARRDLTVNAIARNVHTGEVLDPFDGRGDLLSRRVLRHTTLAFSEDPLRVFRLARFAARLPDHRVSTSTRTLCATLRPALASLSAERIRDELLRALDAAQPSRFFVELHIMHVLATWLPELEALVPVGDKHDGTTWNHTMRVIDAAPKNLRFALLCHDLGKARTPQAEWPTHHKHDIRGIEPTRTLCARLRIPTRLARQAELVTREHMRFRTITRWRPAKALRFIESTPDICTLNDACLWDTSSHVEDALNEHAKRTWLIALGRSSLEAISGKNLLAEGRTPGPALGQELFQRRLNIFKQKGVAQ